MPPKKKNSMIETDQTRFILNSFSPEIQFLHLFFTSFWRIIKFICNKSKKAFTASSAVNLLDYDIHTRET